MWCSVGADNDLASYATKSAEFSLLNSEFENLAKYPEEDPTRYQNMHNVLLERYNVVKSLDTHQNKEYGGIRKNCSTGKNCNKH